MPNGNPDRLHAKGPEVLSDAAQRIGADPLAVRVVRGATTLGVPGYGVSIEKIGAASVDEPTPDLHADLSAQAATIRARFDGALRRFSGFVLFLEFVGGGADAKADIAIFRAMRRADGSDAIVSDGTISNLAHHVLARDALVGGLRTYYQIKNIALDGATAVKLHIAGEGLGYGE